MAMGNNPISITDPDGGCEKCPVKGWYKGNIDGVDRYYYHQGGSQLPSNDKVNWQFMETGYTSEKFKLTWSNVYRVDLIVAGEINTKNPIKNPSHEATLASAEYRVGRYLDKTVKYYGGKDKLPPKMSVTIPDRNLKIGNVKVPSYTFPSVSSGYIKKAVAVFKGVGILSAGVSAASTYYRWQSGEISGTQALVDGAMIGIGFLGPWGMAASAGYSLILKPYVFGWD